MTEEDRLCCSYLGVCACRRNSDVFGLGSEDPRNGVEELVRHGDIGVRLGMQESWLHGVLLQLSKLLEDILNCYGSNVT